MERGLIVYLKLGRVSNLPTVWSNALAGVLLAGGRPSPGAWVLLLLALSAFYLGGMYLNDAFDRAIDARERPERPIPSGRVSAVRVFSIGFGLLAAGVTGVALVSPRLPAIACAVALAAVIVVYDAWHKGNPASPIVMGLCRVGVYLTSALATAHLGRPVLLGAACLMSYLIGLTYVAKFENRSGLERSWPLALLTAPLAYAALAFRHLEVIAFAALLTVWILRALRLLGSEEPRRIPRTVGALIAGIALLDALLLARAGAPGTALLAAAACPLTLTFQRYIPGT